MNQKEFNSILNSLSDITHHFNHILYELIIIIAFYYIFNNVSFNNINSNITNRNHKSFIYLVTLICVGLDWFIWNNCTQTALFIAVLFLYITYNFRRSESISTFIDFMNENKEYVDIIKNNDILEMNDKLQEEIIKQENIDKLNKITFIPKDINIGMGMDMDINKNKLRDPDAYNISANKNSVNNINNINAAYNSLAPYNVTKFNNYSEKELNNLYNTSQYKNIKSNDIDKPLQNDIHISTDSDIVNSQEYIQENIKLFKNPQKIFTDNTWLLSNDNTYNDNCKTCTHTKDKNISSKNMSGKNAICSLVKYGNELSECTNQDATISNEQLNKISNSNHIEPIYKF